MIRGRFAHAAIVLGGEHVTSMAEFCLLTSKADVAVLGEGEETVVELVQALREWLWGEGLLRAKLAEARGDVYRWRDLVTVRADIPITLDLRNVAVERYGPVQASIYIDGEYRRSLTLHVMQPPDA